MSVDHGRGRHWRRRRLRIGLGHVGGFDRTALQWIRGWRLAWLPPLPHVADETHTLARQGLDQTLLGSAVPDGTADGIDARTQRRFGHDAAAPDLLDQLVPANDVLAVSDQMDQKVEGLRLHGDRGRAATQLAPAWIERVLVKNINQIRDSRVRTVILTPLV